MKYTNLPHSDVRVSKICLGTMTWGNQNTQEEGFEQMDYSLDKGVNFLIQQSYTQCLQVPTPMQKLSASSVIGLPLEKIGNKWF